MIVDYRDIMNDQAYNVCFHNKMDSFQNNAALAIIGIIAIRDISRKKLYYELGYKYLESRRCYCKFCCFCKVFKNPLPKYLFIVVPKYLFIVTDERTTSFQSKIKVI